MEEPKIPAKSRRNPESVARYLAEMVLYDDQGSGVTKETAYDAAREFVDKVLASKDRRVHKGEWLWNASGAFIYGRFIRWFMTE